MSGGIREFRGQYRWLSNFWEVPIRGTGVITYRSVENAYQAAKLVNPGESGEHLQFQCCSPSQAKMLGRRVRCRNDWDSIKLEVMEELIRQKFRGPRGEHRALGERLAATDGQSLVEGNMWHDNFWGKCECWNCAGKEGLNHLGKILMKIRGEILEGGNHETQDRKKPGRGG